MKTKLIFLLFAGSFWASAEVPKTRPLTEYYHLWQKSPFTVKPEVVKTEEVIENELDDFVLLGVEVTPHGNLVVVQNVEKQGQRTTITSWDEGSSGFEIVEVKQDPTSTLSTRVLLKKGQQQGWVSYNPQYLTLKSAPAPVATKEEKKEERGRRGRQNTEQKKEAAKPRVKFVRPNSK